MKQSAFFFQIATVPKEISEICTIYIFLAMYVFSYLLDTSEEF
jgi:hypothetical protein